LGASSASIWCSRRAISVQVGALVGPGGDDLVAVVAVVAAGGWQERLIVGDLESGALDHCVRVKQVMVLIANRQGVLQPAHGVGHLGLPGDGVGDQLTGPPE
jgi:hypothetical protein